MKTIIIIENRAFGYLNVNFRLLAKKLTMFVGELHGHVCHSIGSALLDLTAALEKQR